MKRQRRNPYPLAFAALLAAATVAPNGWADSTADAPSPTAAIIALMSADEIEAATGVRRAESIFRHGDPGRQEARELIEALASASTAEARAGLGMLLGLVADREHVPMLLVLAASEETSDAARGVLELIPGTEADDALVALLSSPNPRIARGALHSVAIRRINGAVADLARLARSGEEEIARDALWALGFLSSEEALSTLLALESETETGTPRRQAWEQALLASASSGNGRPEVLAILMEPLRSVEVRGSALIHLAGIDPDQHRAQVVELIADAGSELHGYGLLALGAVANADTAQELAGSLPGMTVEVQSTVLWHHASVPSEALLRSALSLLASDNVESKRSAVEFLARRDGRQSFELLLAASVREQADTAALAVSAMTHLRDESIDPLLLSLLDEGAREEQAGSSAPDYDEVVANGVAGHARALLNRVAEVVGNRELTDGVPTLLGIVPGGDRALSFASIGALGRLATEKDLPAMMDLVEDLPSASRGRMTDAIAMAVNRHQIRGVGAEVRRRFASTTDDNLKAAWLGLAARVGDEEAGQLLAESLGSPVQSLRRAAIRSLGDWKDAEPIASLTELIRTTEQEAERTLAARSILGILERLVDQQESLVIEETGRLLDMTDIVEVQRRSFSLLSATDSDESWDLVFPYLRREEVQAEAAMAAARLGINRLSDDPRGAIAKLMSALEQLDRDNAARRAYLRTVRHLLPVYAPEMWESDPYSGFWEGELVYRGNASRAVALVYTNDFGSFRVQLREEFDGPHRVLAHLEGTDGPDEVQISGWDWVGTITGDVMQATIPGTEDSRFEMRKVERVSPTIARNAPEDAIVLFDGTSFDEWHGEGENGAVTWTIVGDAMEVSPMKGSIVTKREFKDFELHLEFRSPYSPGNPHQFYGNSGVFLQWAYEIQVLNSFGLESGIDDCAAIYGVVPPRVNASFPPTQWQTYDVVHRGPTLAPDGTVEEYGRLTVLHNGVVVHEDYELTRTSFEGVDHPGTPRPLLLQDHHNRVQYRNVWIRELKTDEEVRLAKNRILSKETSE